VVTGVDFGGMGLLETSCHTLLGFHLDAHYGIVEALVAYLEVQTVDLTGKAVRRADNSGRVVRRSLDVVEERRLEVAGKELQVDRREGGRTSARCLEHHCRVVDGSGMAETQPTLVSDL
jgi:hypothetical protein